MSKATGTNGVPFGSGYKGKGMCASCGYSEVTPANVPYAGAPPQLMCNYYGRMCRSVSRNCKGIKSFRDTPLKLERPAFTLKMQGFDATTNIPGFEQCQVIEVDAEGKIWGKKV